jgi:hypothetical protein
MKKVLYIAAFFSTGLVFTACDFVKNAVEQQQSTGGGPQPDILYRKVLIEDYTGHKCGNCPAAADDLHRIDSIYEGKVIAMAVHAGGFAGTNPLYPTNFMTPDGDIFDNTFGISTAGNPNGLVNRKGWGSSDFISGWTTWETKAVPFMSEEADFKISINNTFNSGANQVTSAVTVKANKAVSGTYNLSVVLVEDSIIAEQLDYRLPSGQQRITNYVFMHVLRGSLNTTWGEQVLNGSWAKNDSIVKTYSNYSLSTYVPKNCHIIAFVYNADNTSASYYEVMQVEEAEVEP